MKLSNLKVGTRLGMGFGVLLIACLTVGGIGWVRLAQLDEVVNRITTENWEKARLTMEMEIRTRDNAFKTGRVLMAGDDTEAVKVLKAEMAENSKLNGAALEQLEKLVVASEAKMLLAEAADARQKYMDSRAQVTKLAADPKTQREALDLFRTETAGLLEQYMTPFRKLTERERADFEKASRDSDATYLSARNTIVSASVAALIVGILLAITLARGITRPLRNAVAIAKAVKAGQLDNQIDVSGEDETAELLSSLDAMQSALRERDERDADYRGQIAAIGKSQTVAEFGMDGRILNANENFLNVMGYALDEIRGQHHSVLVDPTSRQNPEYRELWDKLARGEFDGGQYRRVSKDGWEVWIQASYNPIADAHGKWVKVVEYATDITEQKLRTADYEGQLAAIGKAQAVIEFNVDGTIRSVNDNFAKDVRLHQRRRAGQTPQHAGGSAGERRPRVPRVLGQSRARRSGREPLQAHCRRWTRSVGAGFVQPDSRCQWPAFQGGHVRHRRDTADADGAPARDRREADAAHGESGHRRRFVGAYPDRRQDR